MKKSSTLVGKEITVPIVMLVSVVAFIWSSPSGFSREPGDPIDLGHVHKPYGEDDGDDDNSSPTPTYSAAATPTYSETKSSSGTPMLQATIEHSRDLAPVKNVQVGSVFDQNSQLQSVPTERKWVRVPPWLAGKWQEETYTRTSYVNYKTGQTYSIPTTNNGVTTEHWGIQRDRAGGMWDVIKVPFMGTTTSNKHIWKDLHTGDSMLLDSDSRVVTRQVATRSVVDKATNTITKVNQLECISSLSIGGPDMIRTDYSMKMFDQNGSPIDLSVGWRIGHRIAPFEVNNFVKGEDIRSSFREYLISHGMADLVPLDQI